MGYCSQADLVLEIGTTALTELTDDAGEGEVDADIVTFVIANADAVIDGYLGMVYTLPLTATPTLIRKISLDLSVYDLYSRKTSGEIPPIRAERRAEAVALLEKIGAGTISFPATQATELSGDDTLDSTTDIDDRIVTMTILENL